MELRPFQLEVENDIRRDLRDVDSVCAVLPTGAGKTVIIADITAKSLAKGRTSWIVMHRQELVEQTCDKLRAFGIPHGIIMGGQRRISSKVQVCMVQSLRNAISKGYSDRPDNLIMDECHHMASDTYTFIEKAMKPGCKRIGFTATPERLDGKGLGEHYERKVEGPQIAELIDMGYLVPPVVYRPPSSVDPTKLHTKHGDYVKAEMVELMDKPKITGDVIEHYRELANGLAAVAFCVTVAHAEHVAKEFNAAGIPAASVDGSMKKHERKRVLDAFRDGSILVLCSADLISEGFDLPRIECCILLRPTKSLSVFLQQVGRSLRLADGKTQAIIIDHVDNCKHFGLPDSPRHWSMEGRKAREKQEDETDVTLRTCKKCFVMYIQDRCPKCGTIPIPAAGTNGIGTDLETVEGKLVLAQSERKHITTSEHQYLLTAASTADLTTMCEAMQIKMPTAGRILRERARTLPQLRSVEKLMNYAHGWHRQIYEARHGTQGLKEALEAEKAGFAELPFERKRKVVTAEELELSEMQDA